MRGENLTKSVISGHFLITDSLIETDLELFSDCFLLPKGWEGSRISLSSKIALYMVCVYTNQGSRALPRIFT